MFEHIGDVVTQFCFEGTNECGTEMPDHILYEILTGPYRRRHILMFEDLGEITFNLFNKILAAEPAKELQCISGRCNQLTERYLRYLLVDTCAQRILSVKHLLSQCSYHVILLSSSSPIGCDATKTRLHKALVIETFQRHMYGADIEFFLQLLFETFKYQYTIGLVVQRCNH